MNTPKTDRFLIEGGNYTYASLADFARKLEGINEELIAALKPFANIGTTTGADFWIINHEYCRRARIALVKAQFA